MNAKEFLDKFPNSPLRENCLEDMGCPQCGQRDCLKIEMSSRFELFDNGTGDNEDTEWDEHSPCQCPECLHEGTAGAFTHKGLDKLICDRMQEQASEL